MCKSWCELIIAIVVIVFGWPELVNWYNGWILVAAGVVLLIHSFTCKKCFGHGMSAMKSMPVRSSSRKSSRRRKRR